MMLDEALKENGESWADVEANTMTEDEMAKNFDAGYGWNRTYPSRFGRSTRCISRSCYDGAGVGWQFRATRTGS